MSELVHVERRGDIAVVVLDRPPANTLAPDLVAGALEVLDALTAESPPAVVMTGTAGFFCAGADLRLVPTLSPDEQAGLARSVNALFAGWFEFPRPLVMAVNGHAVAGGLVLALCGDHRVGSTSGRFGLTEVKAGIPFPSAAMAVVQAELTAPVVRRMVLHGELFDSAAAAELAIFDEVVPDGAVLDRAIEVAEELAALPRATYEVVKARLKAGVIERSRGQFGGAAAASQVVEEAAGAAARLLTREP